MVLGRVRGRPRASVCQLADARGVALRAISSKATGMPGRTMTSFNLNVDNVLNAKFGWQPASRLTVSPYPGTTVRLTTAVKF